MTESTNTEKPFEYAEIVAAEYEYIAQTAFQAQDDRASVTTFYLVNVGSIFGAALFGTTQTQWSDFFHPAFSALLFFLTFFGFLTLKQLIALRLAWFNSAKAMNQIKKYLMEQNPDLEKAFLWNHKTLPSKYKNTSVAYYLVLQVTTMSAITFGAAVSYLILSIAKNTSTELILFAGALSAGIFLFAQLGHYRKELEK